MKLDIERVCQILAETAAEEVLPRYQALTSGQIRTKSGPNDLVTVADEAAEVRLSAALTALLPGSVAVGEEAVSADPALLTRLGASDTPTWIIDPIDGTWNFAHGTERFCMMVALSRDDTLLAAWIYEPLKARCTTAERGAGTWRRADSGDTARITTPPPPSVRDQRGFVYHRHVDNSADPRLARWGSAGIEYLELLAGRAHFSCYDRSMPWDHAPGSLLIAEAGGQHGFADGGSYHPSGGPKRAVFAAAQPTRWAAARDSILPDPERY